MSTLTFDAIPQAIATLTAKVDALQETLDKFMSQYNDPSVNEGMIGVDEACEILKLKKSTIYNYIEHNTLPHYQPGRKLLFKRSELLAWLAETKQSHQDRIQAKLDAKTIEMLQPNYRRKPRSYRG